MQANVRSFVFVVWLTCLRNVVPRDVRALNHSLKVFGVLREGRLTAIDQQPN